MAPDERNSGSEADILDELVGPDGAGMTADAAKHFLALAFSARSRERMRELTTKNNMGLLTEAERAEMDAYLRVGAVLDLLQAKARLLLKETQR